MNPVDNRYTTINRVDERHTTIAAYDGLGSWFEHIFATTYAEVPPSEPSPTDAFSAIDRRRQAVLRRVRQAVHAQLAALPLPVAEQGPEAHLYRTIVTPDELRRPTGPAGLWLPPALAAFYVGHQPPAAWVVDGYVFTPIAPHAALQTIRWVQQLASQSARAFAHVKRMLSDFARRISVALSVASQPSGWSKQLAHPDHPHDFVSTHRTWHLSHGAHPPRASAFVARPIPHSLFQAVEPRNRLEALAA